MVECGPASAVVHFRGKTTIFRGGTCKIQDAGFSLYLGTRIVNGSSSNRLFLIELPRRAATSYLPSSANIGLQLDYASYQWQTGLLTVSDPVRNGTFTGKLIEVKSRKPAGSFSGAFTCSGKL